MNAPIGHKRWAIAEGYIPGWSNGPEPQLASHETACLLNASDHDARRDHRVLLRSRARGALPPDGPYQTHAARALQRAR